MYCIEVTFQRNSKSKAESDRVVCCLVQVLDIAEFALHLEKEAKSTFLIRRVIVLFLYLFKGIVKFAFIGSVISDDVNNNITLSSLCINVLFVLLYKSNT